MLLLARAGTQYNFNPRACVRHDLHLVLMEM